MKKIFLMLSLLLIFNLVRAENDYVQINSTSNLQNSIDLKIKASASGKVLVYLRVATSKVILPPKDTKELVSKAVNLPVKLDKPELIYFSNNAIDLKVSNLKSETDYSIDIYQTNEPDKFKFLKSIDFNTIASEPSKQASTLAFKNTIHNEISLLWKSGDGQNAIVVCKKGSKPDLPVDGKEYVASLNFGDATSKIGNGSFVVFSGKYDKSKEVRIKNLAYDDYYFQIFEYNGKGKYTNYNTKIEKSNARNKHTLLPPPVAKNISIGKEGLIKANWSNVEQTEFYVIELSYNEKFTQFVDTYNSADVGNVNEIEMVLPENEKSKIFYFRVKAQNQKSISLPSNILKIDTGK